jgi:hypothetical protein
MLSALQKALEPDYAVNLQTSLRSEVFDRPYPMHRQFHAGCHSSREGNPAAALETRSTVPGRGGDYSSRVIPGRKPTRKGSRNSITTHPA